MRYRTSYQGKAPLWAIVLVVLAALGLFLGLQYNSLVSKDTRVQELAANIDSQVKRRADLIPNLVNTVKGYAKHESTIFTEVAEARSRLLNSHATTNPAESAAAQQGMNTVLGRLLALAENYPDLKADKQFIHLQDELAGTENRINYARLQYNKGVRDYNTAVRIFPTNLLANLFGFSTKTPFQIAAVDKANPKVEF